MTSRLPQDVYAFLRAHIRSIGQLEVLLLLQRDHERSWTADQVNRELRTSLHAARKNLEALCEMGLVHATASAGERWYRFAVDDASRTAVVRRLEEMFPQWVSAIVEAIYEPPEDSIRHFADAFRLRQKPEDD